MEVEVSNQLSEEGSKMMKGFGCLWRNGALFVDVKVRTLKGVEIRTVPHSREARVVNAVEGRRYEVVRRALGVNPANKVMNLDVREGLRPGEV